MIYPSLSFQAIRSGCSVVVAAALADCVAAATVYANPASAKPEATASSAAVTSAPGPGLHLSGTQGPLVLLQAGLGEDHGSWALLVADLARDHRVLALDRPGRGGLPASTQPRDPCTQADEARQRLQAAGLAPPYLLVGHSLGGRYAAAQALRHPGEAMGLVLVDATPPGHWARMQAETPGLATLVKALRSTVFDASSRREFDDQDGCMDSLAAAAASGGSGAAPVPSVVLASGRRRPEETPEFAALLARGQAQWLPLTGAARVEVAHDAGHYIQRDAPDRVAAAVRRLSGQPAADMAAAPAPAMAPAASATTPAATAPAATTPAATTSAATTPAAADNTLPEAWRQGLQQLQPGATTRQQAQQALGDPTERQRHADAEVWIYNPRQKLPPLVGWLPVLGDALEVAALAHQRLRRHELILQFDTAGVLRRRTVRALDG